jgi:hypothetical protein
MCTSGECFWFGATMPISDLEVSYVLKKRAPGNAVV